MDSEEKNENKFGRLVLIGVPEKTRLCIDNNYLKIGSKFKGVKHLPVGAHYVYYTLEDEKHQFKIGFFIYIGTQEVVIRKWDEANHAFINIDRSEEGERYYSAARNFELDPYLAPFSEDKSFCWGELSLHISRAVLNKLEPVEKNIYSEYTEYNLNDGEKGKEPFRTIGGTIYFTEVPQKLKYYGATAEALTKMNFDKTTILKNLIEKEYSGDYQLLLGEFQFSYIIFLLGENFEGFEQWKKLFMVFSFSEDYLYEKPAFFLDLIPVLYSHLRQLPKDFFEDSISKDSFVSSGLRNLFEFAEDKKIDKKVKGRILKLRSMLKELFGFDFTAAENELDFGEDGPTIVEDFNFLKLDE